MYGIDIHSDMQGEMTIRTWTNCTKTVHSYDIWTAGHRLCLHI